MIKYYDLTIPQKSIWYTDQFYKNTSITNVSGTGIIKERVNIELLEQAINIVVKNNDSLRIRVVIQENVPKQYFEEYKKFKVECIEVKDENEQKVLIDRLVREHIDILNEASVKFVIFKFPDGSAGFNIVGSHITADAWGSARVCSEVINVYSKLLNNEDIEDVNKTSYIDYIEKENEYLNTDKYLKDKEYWEGRFEDVSNEVAQIVPNNETVNLDTKAIRKEIKLDTQLTKKINEYCRENRISPFVFFFGVYSIYLANICGLDEIIIGTPMLNRNGIKEKEIIGMFVNNLPFKIDINQEDSLKELFQKIAQDSMQMLRHQKYSYMELLKSIREKTKISNNLYDVVLSYQNAKTTANESKVKYNAKWNFNGNISETINIHISDIDSEENYNIFYDYQENKLNDKEIINIHNRILNIIDQIFNTNIKSIADIQIVTNDEIEKLKTFNNTGNFIMNNKNIIDIFEDTANRCQEKVALKYDDKQITYKEMIAMINSLAIKLREMGVNRNTPVAMILDKSIDMIVSMFAILKAGGCYVPILPEEQQDRIDYILNDCNPTLIITHKDYYKLIGNRKYINLDNENELNNNTIETINDMNDIAYIIYTSGTTGTPKGVKVMHKNVCGLKMSLESDKIIKPSEDDISISLLKYSFDASGIDIYSSLLFGGKLVLVKKEDELNPSVVVKLMEREKVTRSFLIPKWLEHINIEDNRQNTDLSSLKILGTGGEVLKPELIKSLYNKYTNLKIINLYGPTETTMFTTYNVVNSEEIEQNYSTIGKLINGSRAIVVNKKNKLLPIGIAGELCLYEDDNSIKNIAQGYLNKEIETNKKFLEIYNPIISGNSKIYKTGDIVKINDNLELEFEGRKDDIVKVNGGYLVALNEVERRIYNILEEKYEVASFAVPFNNTKAIVVFVKNRENNTKIDNISEKIKSKLTFYMHPKRIIELDEFPRNNSGKMDKKKLRDMAIKSVQKSEEVILPKHSTEQIIYNIIKKYTNSENISITDDFIQDLGIDSLTIASVYTELESFGIELQDIYTYTNIKDLAYFIDIGKKKNEMGISDNIIIKNNVKQFDMTNILLTGVTGFLGIHLLYELINNSSVKKIYCIIRNKEDKTAKDRLYDSIGYYFDNRQDVKDLINEKVIIIEGSITQENFGISDNEYRELQHNITTVINSAANVRHYGKESSINTVNVNSVKIMLDFCKRSNASFAHVSTLSIGGFKTEESEKEKFNENTLFIGQKLNNNPYLMSKYRAEELILNNTEVNSKIFRVGNIMPRTNDGKFQKNYQQNAFMNAIRIMLELKKVPQEYLKIKVELSPVDECASSIIKLTQSSFSNRVFHIVNEKLITIKDFIDELEKLQYNIDIVKASEFIEKLNKYSGIGKFYIKEYILKNKVNKYSTEITENCLYDLGFSWKKINKNYIESITKIIEKNRWENE